MMGEKISKRELLILLANSTEEELDLEEIIKLSKPEEIMKVGKVDDISPRESDEEEKNLSNPNKDYKRELYILSENEVERVAKEVEGEIQHKAMFYKGLVQQMIKNVIGRTAVPNQIDIEDACRRVEEKLKCSSNEYVREKVLESRGIPRLSSYDGYAMSEDSLPNTTASCEPQFLDFNNELQLDFDTGSNRRSSSFSVSPSDNGMRLSGDYVNKISRDKDYRAVLAGNLSYRDYLKMKPGLLEAKRRRDIASSMVGFSRRTLTCPRKKKERTFLEFYKGATDGDSKLDYCNNASKMLLALEKTDNKFECLYQIVRSYFFKNRLPEEELNRLIWFTILRSFAPVVRERDKINVDIYEITVVNCCKKFKQSEMYTDYKKSGITIPDFDFSITLVSLLNPNWKEQDKCNKLFKHYSKLQRELDIICQLDKHTSIEVKGKMIKAEDYKKYLEMKSDKIYRKMSEYRELIR